MSKSRKKVFPKPPQKFHSKLAHELGKWSNKNGYEASVKAIYNQESRLSKLTDVQSEQLDKLKKQLAGRKSCNVQ